MSATLPEAIANVVSVLGRAGLGYVFYRDPVLHDRVFVLVEGDAELQTLRSVLRDAGAEQASKPDEFIARASSAGESDEAHTIIIRAAVGGGKTGIANLLWLAATDASAIAARDSLSSSSVLGSRHAVRQ